MVSNFPSPVLSLAADTIKDLDGGDALSRLWTSMFSISISFFSFSHSHSVFTKCKESLQDGRRLENISWRLWHRELSARSAPLAITPHLPLLICPLTPVSERGIEHPGKFFLHLFFFFLFPLLIYTSRFALRLSSISQSPKILLIDVTDRRTTTRSPF